MGRVWTCVAIIAGIAGCSSGLTPPREVIRISGTVSGSGGAPVDVEIYERCSPRLYVFERCPGKRVGRARIPKPGGFLVAVDSEAEELSVVAFRGVAPGQEDECVVENVPARPSAGPLELELHRGACPIARPEPITASARAPVSHY